MSPRCSIGFSEGPAPSRPHRVVASRDNSALRPGPPLRVPLGVGAAGEDRIPVRDVCGMLGGRRRFAPPKATKHADVQDCYGSDGTRTRDLRRDRPVLVLPGWAQFLVRNQPYARGRRVLSRLVADCIIVLGSQEREIRYESGFARAGGAEHAQTKRYPRRADLLQLRAIAQERHRPLGLARRAAVIGTSFRLQDKPSDFIG